MVFLVREPVERAVSEINMFRDRGRINGTDDELSQLMQEKITSKGYSITAGEYARHLKKWLEVFPKEQLLVVNTKALADASTWHRIFEHVGLARQTNEWIEK